MRWLRPTVTHDTPEEALDDVARSLEAAAHEAPPPRRAETIREALLDDVGADRRAAPGLMPLALAAGVLLLALVVGIGGPAVGSWIGDMLDISQPAPNGPELNATDEADHDDLREPSRTAAPRSPSPAVPSPSASDLPNGSSDPSPAVDDEPPIAPTPTPTPTPDGPPPHASPDGPPSPMPTPPIGVPGG